MDMTTILFYGGIGTAAIGAALLLLSFFMFHNKKTKLDAVLEREYGDDING